MDLDSAALWFATRGDKTHDAIRQLGVDRKLLNGKAKKAWDFVSEYREEHGSVPPAGVVAERFGMSVSPPGDEEERIAAHTYVVDLLFERQQHKALTHGLGLAEESLEKGNQDESVAEVLKLSDFLRESRTAQLQLHSLADVAEDVFDLYERIERGEIGVPFPWQIMTDMTLGMWPGTLTFFVARPGVGKCVHEDTEIVDPQTGVPRAAWKVHESREHTAVTSWSKEDGVHARPITAKIDTGSKECLRFTTRSGRSITVTPEHPFLTPEGWRRADELGRGASIASPARMPFPQKPKEMEGVELDVLAILLAEGSYSGNHVGFSTTDPAILSIAGNAAEELGVDLVYRSGCDYDFVRRGTGRHPVRELLRQLGADRKIAKEKTISDEVFRLPREQLARFLTIFWMCDGTVSKRGEATITLASEVMVRQIQSLLLRFGIQSRVAYRPIKGGFDAWRLRVYSHCLDAFREHLSLWGQKGERIQESVVRNPNVGSPRLSDACVEKLKALSKVGAGRWSGGLHEKVADELGRSGFSTRDLFGSGNSVKMTAFRAFAMIYGIEDEYRWWWDSGIFWDEVESIEAVGEQKIYDLTVAPTSCFVANDLIVHNTWTAVLIAMHAWSAGKKVLIVSPELGRVELGERMVAKYGKISYRDMVSGSLGSGVGGQGGKHHLRAVVDELKKVAKNLIILDNEEKLHPEYIEQAIQITEPDLVLFDSIYMLRVEQGKVRKGPGSGGGNSKSDRMERLIQTIDWMRVLTRRQWSFAPSGLPIVGIHQLSRDGKVRKEAAKNLKQGRGTGGLEDAVALSDVLYWNAHNLFAMYQDEYMRQDKQLLYAPLKVRRQAMASSLVVKWDMEAMEHDQIGSRVAESDDYEDQEAGDVPY